MIETPVWLIEVIVSMPSACAIALSIGAVMKPATVSALAP